MDEFEYTSLCFYLPLTTLTIMQSTIILFVILGYTNKRAFLRRYTALPCLAAVILYSGSIFDYLDAFNYDNEALYQLCSGFAWVTDLISRSLIFYFIARRTYQLYNYKIALTIYFILIEVPLVVTCSLAIRDNILDINYSFYQNWYAFLDILPALLELMLIFNALKDLNQNNGRGFRILICMAFAIICLVFSASLSLLKLDLYYVYWQLLVMSRILFILIYNEILIEAVRTHHNDQISINFTNMALKSSI